jgi:hypothetical protein
MGTTAHYAFRYPASTDAHAPDVDIHELADDVDTALFSTDGLVSVMGSAIDTLTTQMSETICVHNVVAYGAVGDGVTDDSAAIQAAVNAACAADGRGMVIFPAGLTYAIGATITIVDSCELRGPGTILALTATMTGFMVTSIAPVRFTNLTLTSPNCVTFHAWAIGIRCNENSRVIIDGCEIRTWASKAVYGQKVVNLIITNCYIAEFGFYGVHLEACSNVLIGGSRIVGGPPSAGVTYAASISTGLSGSTECQNVRIVNNTLDTSAILGTGCLISSAVGCVIADNLIKNTYHAIRVVYTSTFAPQGVSITGNTIISGTNGDPIVAKGYGIVINGVAGGNPATATVVGNYISGYGSATYYGAIVAISTRGSISGNTLWGNGQNGIRATAENHLVISDNVISGVYSNTSATYGIYISSTANFIVMSSNIFADGPTIAATYTNGQRIRCTSDGVNSTIECSKNITRGTWGELANSERRGTTAMNGTTAVVVANVTVTAKTMISLTWASGVPAGIPYLFAQSAGVSFSLKSTNAGDTAHNVCWELFEGP